MECQHAMNLTLKAVKGILPEKAIVTKDAKTKLNTAATMFTLYLSATAQEICAQHKRQTITSRDVLQALREMDFEQFLEPVETYVRESKQQQKKPTKKPSIAQVHVTDKENVAGNDNAVNGVAGVEQMEDVVDVEDRDQDLEKEDVEMDDQPEEEEEEEEGEVDDKEEIEEEEKDGDSLPEPANDHDAEESHEKDSEATLARESPQDTLQEEQVEAKDPQEEAPEENQEEEMKDQEDAVATLVVEATEPESQEGIPPASTTQTEQAPEPCTKDTSAATRAN